MNTQEAINHLHTYSSTNGSGQTTQDQHEEAKRMARAALEKQIPKKPSEGQVHIVYLCPNCGSLDYTLPYCRHCGQRLSWKWGVIDDE